MVSVNDVKEKVTGALKQKDHVQEEVSKCGEEIVKQLQIYVKKNPISSVLYGIGIGYIIGKIIK